MDFDKELHRLINELISLCNNHKPLTFPKEERKRIARLLYVVSKNASSDKLRSTNSKTKLSSDEPIQTLNNKKVICPECQVVLNAKNIERHTKKCVVFKATRTLQMSLDVQTSSPPSQFTEINEPEQSDGTREVKDYYLDGSRQYSGYRDFDGTFGSYSSFDSYDDESDA